VTASYYRHAHAVVYVYDVVDERSLDKIRSRWTPFVDRATNDADALVRCARQMLRNVLRFATFWRPDSVECTRFLCRIMVGNKIDLMDEEKIDMGPTDRIVSLSNMDSHMFVSAKVAFQLMV